MSPTEIFLFLIVDVNEQVSVDPLCKNFSRYFRSLRQAGIFQCSLITNHYTQTYELYNAESRFADRRLGSDQLDRTPV